MISNEKVANNVVKGAVTSLTSLVEKRTKQTNRLSPKQIKGIKPAETVLVPSLKDDKPPGLIN